MTTRDHVGYESWLERDRLILLDFDPDVVGIASQPFWSHWRDGGAKRRHAPDYFVRLADGRARIVDVRAEDCRVCWRRRHGSARQRGRR
ncbi:TnsA-like heteromeric transposase endonuclease subunit, partial [Streptomyces sp. NPDC056230]